jgi:hypothetical protein
MYSDVIAAADFSTTEVWTARGLVTYYRFFVIDHATRAIEILASTPYPGEEFMKQVARKGVDHDKPSPPPRRARLPRRSRPLRAAPAGDRRRART